MGNDHVGFLLGSNYRERPASPLALDGQTKMIDGELDQLLDGLGIGSEVASSPPSDSIAQENI